MYTFAVTLSALLAISSVTGESLHFKNELKDVKADMLMKKVEQHCQAISRVDNGNRRKREVNYFRSFLLGALQDCHVEPDDSNPTTEPPTTPSDGVAGPCTSPSTVNLTGSWRLDNQGSNLQPIDNYYACDRDLQGNSIWFRFTGTAGSQLSDSCAPAYSCGAHGGFWSNADMPSAVGEERMVPIYGSWNGNCYWYTWPTANALTVQRCSARPGDFVYKVYGTSSCYWTFCGMELGD